MLRGLRVCCWRRQAQHGERRWGKTIEALRRAMRLLLRGWRFLELQCESQSKLCCFDVHRSKLWKEKDLAGVFLRPKWNDDKKARPCGKPCGRERRKMGENGEEDHMNEDGMVAA